MRRRCTPLRWRYLERCGGSVPYRAVLNWIPVSGISASTGLKTTHGALPPVLNFHPWSLCCRQERAECKKKKEANRKDGEKYGNDEGWVFHDTNGLLISRASKFAPIFCFKARYIVKKKREGEGTKKSVMGEKRRRWHESGKKDGRN